MRISDWSSDVCSSDLEAVHEGAALGQQKAGHCPAFLFRRGSARWQRGALAPEQADDEQDHDRSDQGADEACRFAGLVEAGCLPDPSRQQRRSEEHTSELQSLMRISYAVFCLKKKKYNK